MGAGWIAIGLMLFTWALAWLTKQLRDGKRDRRRSMRSWIDGDDDE